MSDKDCLHCGCPLHVHADDGSCKACEAQPMGGPCARHVMVVKPDAIQPDKSLNFRDLLLTLAAMERASGHVSLALSVVPVGTDGEMFDLIYDAKNACAKVIELLSDRMDSAIEAEREVKE